MRKLALLVLLAALGWLGWREWRERRAVDESEEPRVSRPAAHDAPVGEDAAPPAPAEDPVELERLVLHGQPVAAYLGDMELPVIEEELLATLDGSSAVLDPWLCRAAEEIAFQGALLGDHPPESVLSFFLRSAGAPEQSVAQLILDGSAEDDSLRSRALASALRSPASGRGALILGIGEAVLDDADARRRVVVVSARRPVELEPVARQLRRGQSVVIRGRSRIPLQELHASGLYPDQQIRALSSQLDGDEFWVQVDAGQGEGPLSVSLGATGDEGPFKLLQLELMVGVPLPNSVALHYSAEELFDNHRDAASYAFELLNRDRERHGLAPLTWDAELATIATGHAEDMLVNDFFAHLSPRTGLAHERVARAGYRATASAENLALNDTLQEAEESLMGSVGHRRNILDADMTHAGIGLARDEGERAQWRVVQLFARKVVPIDPEAATDEVRERLAASERRGAGQRLDDSDELDLVAMRWLEGLELSREDLSEQLNGLPNAVAHDVLAEGWRGASVRVQVVGALEELQVQAGDGGASFSHHGIGLRQDSADLRGRIVVLTIQARAR